ncbi:glycosyltransferase [Arthrobacter sp. MDT2-16]
MKDLVDVFGKDVQVLVVDGGRLSLQELDNLSNDFPWADIVSEPDDGIYDGMNKGISRSLGDFLWFLNGGDECSTDDFGQLTSCLSENRGRLIFAGFYLDAAGKLIPRRPRPTSYIRHGLPTSHQAIFYPGDLARATEYNDHFRVSADYDFTARLMNSGVDVAYLDSFVAKFELGGLSEKDSNKIALEAAEVQRTVLKLGRLLRLRSRLRHRVSRSLRSILATYVGLKGR